jgi:UDP-glucose 4-epimerase
MRALVTGGAGFIGSHLVEALVARGDDVTVIDDCRNGSQENLASVTGRIALVDADVLTTDLTSYVNTDVVFHLAGTAYVPPSVDDPIMDFRATAEATLRVLEAVRHSDARPKVVYTSSAAIYGDPAVLPITEDLPPAPVSPYGLHKYAAEQEVRLFAQLYGMRTASARLFSVYGPRQRKQIIFDVVRKIHANRNRIEAFGDGTQVRDFVYVGDVVGALLTIVENAPMRGDIYNVASGAGVTTARLIGLIAEALEADPEVAWTGDVRPGDPHKWLASVAKLRSIGYEPRVPLVEGIAATVRWIEELMLT